jgi:hypothetical protein
VISGPVRACFPLPFSHNLVALKFLFVLNMNLVFMVTEAFVAFVAVREDCG